MSQKTLNLAVAFGLIALAVILRTMPHPANFAPVAAVAIFGGAILPRRMALTVPLLAMMISDFMIGLHSLVPVTWGCYALIAFASNRILAKPSLVKGAAVTLSGSLFFFASTNFAVWLTSGMYSHTWAGLTRCFAMALPFFRNTAASDVLYTSLLFGSYALALKLSRHFVELPNSRTI